MKPWMLAMTSRGRAISVASFTVDGTWIAPVSTNKATITGMGGAGLPGVPAYKGPDITTYDIRCTRIQYYAGGGQSEPVLISLTPSTETEPVPANYCFDDLAGGQYCDTFVKLVTVTTGTSYASTPPTTGASSTALGRTMPGGTGGPATPVTYPAIAVIPGTAYPIKVAAGGFVDIRYEV